MKENQTANHIRVSQDISLSTRRVQQILSSSPHLRCEKRKPRLKLTKDHFQARLQWAAVNVTLGQKWRDVIFSDEKKFNLDGLDDNQYY
jgi:hypothetical protein